MAERGKALYAYLASGSNNVIKASAGTLYGVYTAGTGLVRFDDTHSFAQGVLNLNSASSNTIGYFPSGDLSRGIGFNTGLVAAFATASNTAGVTVEYE